MLVGAHVLPPAPIDEAGWRLGGVLLAPGPKGSFDETAVKDPSIVRHGGRWHVFYTARGRGRYATGYVSARTLGGLATAPRHLIAQARGERDPYGCAPQVFWFAPGKRWYLVFQTNDTNYGPTFCTAERIDDPASWSPARPLLPKDERAKWIDFWVVADARHAYLFYTRDHDEVISRRTDLADFPGGWGPPSVAMSGVHEAVHVYRAKGRRPEYHLFYEMNDGVRFFGMARAASLAGPWTRVTDRYATGEMLAPPLTRSMADPPWTEMVSHGELLRAGHDERLEYDPARPRWLIQGLRKAAYREPYPEMPWSLGLIERASR